MQVPVFKIRHVLVNESSPAISVLSGMVTSVTKEALFVQLGIFVGRGSGVEVDSGVAVDVEVASTSTVAGASVWVAPVIGMTEVSANVGIDVSVLAWLLHAERNMIANIMKVMIRFPSMSTSFYRFD